MSKFLTKLKELSSKLNGSASTQPEPKSGTEVEQKHPHRQRLVRRQVQRGQRLAKRALLRLKRLNIGNIPVRLIKPEGVKQPPLASSKPSGFKRLPVKYLLLLAGVGVGSGSLAAGIGWLKLESSLPHFTPADVLNYVQPETLTVKASDGTILQQSGSGTYDKLKIWQVPKPLIQAFIAIEDRRFYEHEGVDYQGILRAAGANLQAGGVVEGGSTLTQQLARMIFLDQERSFLRKLKEFRLAQKIDRELNKEQILELYLNLVYLGEGAYGVADAAWVYFSKPVDKLTLPEMATLAGLPPSPNEYSPFANKKLALQRRNLVLQQMREAGYITESEWQQAKLAPLTLQRSTHKREKWLAPYFTEYIQKQLPKYVSEKVLKVGGLTVETTLNPEWQKVAEETIAKTVKEEGRSSGFSQAAMVAIDPRNGQIKAMVGGKDFEKNQFNRVTQAMRQPGSTFKPFVYTTALAAGITPYRGYKDAPLTVDGYKPKNYGETYRGWISMRDALISSVNMVAVQILIDVGWKPTIEIARKMGIESKLEPIYSLALGSNTVNLLELTSAYGTLANKGLHTKPHGIRRIIDRHGNIIYQEKFEATRAIEEDTSAIMTWMLRGVVNEGTGQAAALADRPVAGKTGTSDEARDLWFIGYIPQLVTGVWLGNDNYKPTQGASTTAAYTWHEFVAQVVKDTRPEQFPQRPNDLEGRKPQIEVQRIRPKSMTFGTPDSEKKSEDSSPGSSRQR